MKNGRKKTEKQSSIITKIWKSAEQGRIVIMLKIVKSVYNVILLGKQQILTRYEKMPYKVKHVSAPMQRVTLRMMSAWRNGVKSVQSTIIVVSIALLRAGNANGKLIA